MNSLLQSIQSPSDLQSLSHPELLILCAQIRDHLIKVTSKTGGHIGPNLGVVELTIALHLVFHSPQDKFIFDVSHQGYVHKLLTGRQSLFPFIRQSDGLSGFLSRDESIHDSYGAGHAGTALSSALGFAVARDKLSLSNPSLSNQHIVSIIGDASLTCGITLEALNNIALHTKRLIIILNDNQWSISKNVGAFSKYLNEIITNPLYEKFHKSAEEFLNKSDSGKKLIQLISKAKKETKDLLVPSSLFEKFDIRYLGPIDGHNLPELLKYLEVCKRFDGGPILLHIITQKGKGYQIAIDNPEKFHGTSPFDPNTGNSSSQSLIPNYQDIFGKALLSFAKDNPKIIGITAAMPSGTGLNHLAKHLPSQFFDVGIAEEHAVIFAAGLAANGMRPVCAIYSTFLQRAFDPIMHDVCLQNLPVVFCLDRAGLSPNDGPTHHGLFDISFLRTLPNSILMQPKDEDELVDMLWTSLDISRPCFIRYPRGTATGIPIKPSPQYLSLGKAEILRPGTHLAIWALGPFLEDALKIAEKLSHLFQIHIEIINPRFIKPLDTELLKHQATRGISKIITIEDHSAAAGFGSALLEQVSILNLPLSVSILGWPDQFIPHGSSTQQLRSLFNLDFDSLYNFILNLLPLTHPISHDA